MDTKREDRVLTDEETAKKSELLLKYEELLKKEEISWRQKSSVLWLKEDDKNTKFFHKMANAHKRYNNIDQLVIQGELTKEPSRIEGEIVDYYKNLYTEFIRWRPIYQNTQFPVLIEEDRVALQSNFDETEVLRCLKLCASDKAPGQMVSLWVSLSSSGRW